MYPLFNINETFLNMIVCMQTCKNDNKSKHGNKMYSLIQKW